MSVTSPPRGDRAVLIPRRRPGYAGRIHGMQLLVVEFAIFGSLAAFGYRVLAGAGAAIVAAAVIVATLARWRGRWLVERRLLVWRYRRRRRLVRAAGPATATLSVLRRLSPDLRVQDVPVPGGVRVGVARDDAGWFAAATVAPEVMAPQHARVPLELLAASIAEADQAGAVIQLVIQTVPRSAPSTMSPAEQSYQDLLAALGQAPLAADQTTTVVVRIDARSLAEAIGDYHADLSTAPAVCASLLRRVVTSLRQAGIAATMLDGTALVEVLARSCDANPSASAGTAAFQERWPTWRSAQLAQRTFWIRDWPAVRRAPALFDALLAVPTATTAVSLVLDPDPRTGLVDLTALVRVSAPPAELDRTCRAMQRAARGAKTGLFALDGEQAPATYASAPTGGGAR
ncbi:MAG TPA: type VII secretion protein EccE [Micromonosporaceae bacterium]|jgi:type VII secretion protein EccE